jgi:hypothetical protein
MSRALVNAMFNPKTPLKEKKPSVEALKFGGIAGVVNAVEIGIGYGTGYLVYRIIH